MKIRAIEEADIPAVARLFKVLAEQFIVHECTPEGAATFLRENDEAGLRACLALGHVYHVAECEGAIAGFVAVRERKHLFQLFVARQWQGRGLARALWDVARRAARQGGHDGPFTVNASNFAVPVYEALGFLRTAPTQCSRGLYYNPMQTRPQA